jgi:capsular exopolysaccharide synthesis family protein
MSRVEEALNRARGIGRVLSSSSAGAVEMDSFAAEANGGDPAVPFAEERTFERRSAPRRVARVDPAPFAVPPAASFPSAPPASAPVEILGETVYHFDDTVQGKVVVDGETSPISIEQYRRLAATLHGLHVSSGLRSIMVSSAQPRDGKTLTTTNLALTLSESYGHRVLLIDADLRRPSIHGLFGLPNGAGLADGLRSGAAGSLPLNQVSPHLAVLTAGAIDNIPMAGLSSDRMAAIVKEASSRFDWVLIDTPPIGLISDAQLLAGLVDGVLLVVGAGSTDYTAVAKTVQVIGRERILGVVLNRVQHQVQKSAYYQGYYMGAGAPEVGSLR